MFGMRTSLELAESPDPGRHSAAGAPLVLPQRDDGQRYDRMLTQDGHLDYEGLVGEAMREAMRNVVRAVLEDVAKHGLRGEHHFYISFHTDAPGVSVSRRLMEKYPAEMTIVMQHKFWDLLVLQDRFEVKLAFNGIPEKLVVPYAALKVFFDPSVRFGHQFDEPDQTGSEQPSATGGRSANTAGRAGSRSGGTALRPDSRPDKKRTSSARKRPEVVPDAVFDEPDNGVAAVPSTSVAETSDPMPAAAAAAPELSGTDSPKVVSLDKFRKR